MRKCSAGADERGGGKKGEAPVRRNSPAYRGVKFALIAARLQFQTYLSSAGVLIGSAQTSCSEPNYDSVLLSRT